MPTTRALVLGFLLVIGFTVAGCLSVFLRYEIIGTGYLPRGAVAVLLMLVLGSAALGRLAAQLRLGRRELLCVFIMLLVMAAIPGQEYAQHLYLNLLGLVYYAVPEIARPDLYLEDLNPLLVPSLDRTAPAIRWAYEGLPPGARVPWASWVRPLAIWTPYLLALYAMLLCVAAVLSPRWENHEKLLYPLMQIPDELTASSDLQHGPLRSKLLWASFAVSAGLYVLKGLHSYFPGIPDVNLQRTTEQLFAGGPAVAFNHVPLHIYPEMIGIAYLLTSEVGFSLWFFYLFRLGQEFVRNLMGITAGHYGAFEMQTTGGYLVLAVALVWSGRSYLAGVFSALLRRREEGDGNYKVAPEVRAAAVGTLVSFAFIVYWCSQIGMSPGWAVVLFALMPLVSMVVARVICEAGMFIYSSPFRLNEIIFRLVGPHRIGARDLTLMTAVSWVQIRSTATQFLPQAFQGLKLCSLGRLERGRMLWVMMLALTAAILTCHIVAPWVIYRWGVPKLGWWPRGSGLGTVNRLASYLRGAPGATVADWLSLAAGGTITAFLVVMRQRFLWWPFHPAGYVAWLGWPIERYWLSILIGWAAKRAVLRFFGYRAFAALRPAAFGLVLGICVILTFWLVLHFFIEGPPLVIE